MILVSRRTRCWLLLTGTLLFLGTGYSAVYRAGLGPRERSDFTVYWHAGQAVLQGSDIYEAQNSRGWKYMYLPVFAATISPLSLLPKPVAAGVWYLLNVAALLHLAWIAVRLASGTSPRDYRLTLFVVILILSAWPWLSALTRGQVSVLLAWCATIAIDFWIRQSAAVFRSTGAGLALAGAIVLKVFPILVLAWLMLMRRWREVVITFVALLLLTFAAPALVFGWNANLKLLYQWARTVLVPLSDVSAEENARYAQMADPRIDKNQSVRAVVVRIIAPDEEHGEADRAERTARAVALVINAGLLVLSVVALRRGVHRQRDRPAGPGREAQISSAGVVLLLCLFLAPVSWTHNYVLAMLPLATAVSRGWCSGNVTFQPAYRIAVGIWLAGMLGGLTHPIYHVGGHLMAAMAIWVVLVRDLLQSGAPPETRDPLLIHARDTTPSTPLMQAGAE
ncbi:MAG: DUF2029 domain-containing protein [Phycisphaerae bacterium]|nr:DUF2029 domain-containing protein [Phycisphaerae bacterium]MDW8262934.1 glycosyltransferase family 87 protein [Phycisphaerales bacterium]